MRSRVMPGSSPTMARRDPTSRLKSVDLPTLGRPTIASVPTVGGSPCSAVRLDSNCIRRFTKTLSAAMAPTAIAPTAIAPSGYYRDISLMALDFTDDDSRRETADKSSAAKTWLQFVGLI